MYLFYRRVSVFYDRESILGFWSVSNFLFVIPNDNLCCRVVDVQLFSGFADTEPMIKNLANEICFFLYKNGYT